MQPAKLSPAAKGMLALEVPPLPGLLSPLLEWFETRHLELMADAGFGDLRRAHNQVFIHLPAQGARLTALADAAGMSKQAMGELVEDLVAKGFLHKKADPADGRAKQIVWAPRGKRSHVQTMEAFAKIELELAEHFGQPDLERLRGLLVRAVGAVSDSADDG